MVVRNLGINLTVNGNRKLTGIHFLERVLIVVYGFIKVSWNQFSYVVVYYSEVINTLRSECLKLS